MFIVRTNYEISNANIGTGIITKLITDAIGPEGARVRPLHNLTLEANNTEAPVIETLASGDKAFVRPGVIDWTFRIGAASGGLSLQMALESLNTGQWAAMFYDIQADGKQVVYGRKTSTGIKGIPLQLLIALPWTPSDGSASTKYNIQVAFDSKYIMSLLGFVVSEQDPANVQGVQDVLLTGTNAVNVVTVKLVDMAAGTNIRDIYGSELASSTLWKATGDGAPLDIISVAEGADPSSFVVTLDSTDYTALTVGDVVTLNLTTPELLVAADVAPFEAQAKISFTKAA